MSAQEHDDAPETLSTAVKSTCSLCSYHLVGQASGPARFCSGCGILLSLDPSQATPPKRVLIAYDTHSVRRLLSSIVHSLGHAPMEAVDGEEALQIARATQPDFAILDMHMPKKNGLQVLEEFRLDDKLKDMPVIIVARDTNVDLVKKARQLKALDYIHKDAYYDPNDLRKRLDKYL